MRERKHMGNDSQRKNEMISSFACRLLIRGNEAYMIEPSPELCSFFGTTEESYREGIITRIRRDIGAESADALADMLSRKAAAGENFRIVYPSRRADGSACQMQLDGYPAEERDGGRIYNIIEMDVTDIVESRKLAEVRYAAAQSYLNSISDSYLATFRANLSADEVEVINGTDPLITRKEAPSYDMILLSVANSMTRSSDREQFISTFSREALLNAYHSGTTELSMEYLFRPNEGKRPVWARTDMKLLRRPGSNDIIAFDSVSDIDHSRTADIIMNQCLIRAYDFIASIDIKTESVVFVSVNEQTETMKEVSSGDHYSQITEKYAQEHIPAEDREEYLRILSLPHVIAELDHADQYSKTLHAVEDGRNRYKRLTFSYIDRESGLISLVRSDFTELQKIQIEHEEAISTALTAAKQASSAKTNFLSRMSHEIRTPLNAIIGMDTIAAQSINDPEKVADCISKIGISARFLLSLINDILDMSRIESGKMLLKNDKFQFREFINGINTIIYNQAKAKGLDYECTVSSEIAEVYIGDAMKLQQVLINVLGNAVKFTNKGKVSFDIHPLSGRGDQSTLRFTINDTGVGIREEFLDKIFEPFEQGDTSTTTTFGGTGLGLAITKNLLDLMGGTIKVRSIVGVGTEFMINIPLTIDETAVTAPAINLHFMDMHTLIVDDDLVICEQTCNILKEIGMNGEWVTSGAEAVRRVCENFERAKLYDFILIDWKMPDMDGIETTRQIRRIVGPDVTIIIISAYDWVSIEAEARAAGANMMISKPLFRASLVSAFEKAKGQEQEEEKREIEFDFTGCRVLLAEDNSINAEIAKVLLEAKNFTVETVPNGLKALEKFTSNPIGTYQAILMDIRMPLMDGLQATVNIRHWDRSDAKEIPIIAMTANAFDEDIEKSRAAGMNAHLSKPIEPVVMYSTLERLIHESRNS